MLFSLISARSAWLGQREAVLSRNLANSDSPGYRPLDLTAFDKALSSIGQTATALPMAMTAASHQGGTVRAAAQTARARRNNGYEVAPSGNAVVLEEQMQKLAVTQLDHQLATNLYGRAKGMLKTALGLPQG